MSEDKMRIGDAAARVGVAAHVLRHWEDVGVLVPPRSASGHRTYGEETIARAHLILTCQRAGLSLAEIASLTTSNLSEKSELIASHRLRIQDDLQRLRRTDRFLGHVLTCRHPLINDCDDCRDFALSGVEV